MAYERCSLRVEDRILVDEHGFQAVLDGIYRNRQPVLFTHHTVCDLYLDNSTGAQVGAPGAPKTNGGPPGSLRLRSYGTPKTGSCIYLEYTMQWDTSACRRRLALTLDEAESNLSNSAIGGALREQQGLLTGAEPRLLVAFERSSYTFDDGIAFSVDSGLRYRDNVLDLRAGDDGRYLLPNGWRILKVENDSKRHLLQALGSHHKPVDFTYFGYAYIASMLKERRECA